MRRLFSSLLEFIEHAGLSLFATLVTAAAAILIIVISWFWPSIYSILESNHIFQALVLLMFIEVITLSIKQQEKKEQLTIFIEETDAASRLFEVVAKRRIQMVRISSAGLSSRRVMIDQLLKARVRVRVLAQDPNTAIDRRDASHTLDNVQELLQVAHVQNANLLMRLNVNVATVRAILLYEPNDRARHLFFGWYTYGDQNTRIEGSQNPTLYVSSESAIGRRLCEWVERLLDSVENEARDVPVDKISPSTQDKT
jgi:hypothetical protein